MNSSDLDLKGLVSSYLKHWKWFVLSVFVACFIAFMYLRYTIPQYEAYAKVQILEDKGAASELSVLKDLDIFSAGSGGPKIVDEIELLKARDNFKKVIKKLKLNTRYYVLGNIRDNEIYGSKYPFAINFLSPDSIVENFDHTFYVKIISETEFNYSDEEDGVFQKYSFGANLNTDIGDIILLPETKNVPLYKDNVIRVEIRPMSFVLGNLRALTKMKVAGEFSNIIDISLMDSKKQRAVDILNNLVEINNENAVADKKEIADRTTTFINDRIAEIYSNLSSVDETAETFKENRGIADLGSQSNVNFTQSAASEKQLQDANIQLNIASSMKDLVSDQEEYDFIPTNVGLNDQGIASAAQQYNNLVAQRNRLLKSSNEKNPVIVKLDQQLDGLRKGMQSSLNNVTNNLNLQVNSLSKQLSQINSRIYAAPSNERALRDISRKQQTTESLYLYLLQKREESQITFASAAPKSKIINYAYSSPFPVTPKRKIIFLMAFMFGLLIPFSIIYVRDLLDDKVHNKLDLEKITEDIPVIVEVPKLGKKDNRLVQKDDRSVLAESLRILRTNLNYIQRSHKSSANNIIFITSSVPGEGKTFISSNLAAIYANTGKKVLLIGADIRNPKLYDFFSSGDVEPGNKVKPRRSTKDGLTEYLVNSNLKIQDITIPAQVNENAIDIIFSGKIPPNPTELLMQDRMGELFKQVSEIYDYVIVDTAPLMVVTDTLLISEYASQILYVVKAGGTEKKVLNFPVKLKSEGKLKGLSFVVNNVKQSNLGYGGKYGYGYGKSIKKWWNFS
ncbi:GumC family protein [Flagellimonas okinawensis]|uniref:non-specific protein-tyrosine kinase n=1 Tax=Flagellimonas okinawensis TaxID=3031324 RepID=A0ABT5XR15_9FLAO|nr:tyrosine-protein kinase family protein [[Muricauda] okinawensis]MDF0708345.1 polysaccharide biosynthesis tyrosine autokinase [[Muricauda] okinawensis]